MYNFVLRGVATKWFVQHRDDISEYAQTVNGDFSWRPVFGCPITYLKDINHCIAAHAWSQYQ